MSDTQLAQSRYTILEAIRANGGGTPLSTVALSRYTNLNQATVKRAVSQLVSLGLVDRRLVLGEDGRYRKFLTVV